MAKGEGLVTFLPNSMELLTNNNGGLVGNNLGGVSPILTINSQANISRLALYYEDIKSSGPSIWYFKGVMPRHYGGNGILVNALVAFQNTSTYSETFYVNFTC